MKKLLLATSLTGVLILGACGNNESESKDSKQEQKQLTFEQEEKIQKKELRKLAKQLVESFNIDEDVKSKELDKDIKDLDKALKVYEDKTKDLKQVDTIISEPIEKSSKAVLVSLKQIKNITQFEEDNPELKETTELISGDLYYNISAIFESINMEYEDVDAEYKKDILGKELTSDISDMFYVEYDLMDFAENLGKASLEYSETLTPKQLELLTKVDYRTELYKLGNFDEPDVSKNEYNSLVDDYNELAPKFLHYKRVNEMVSTDQYNIFMDVRNGIVGANTDSEVEDYEDDMEEDTEEDFETDTEEDTETDESGTVTRENVMDFVEEYEGETLDTDTYTFKEPEQKEDGSWGFAYYTKDGELAGSYIVDEDGAVTKYDEDGIEE